MREPTEMNDLSDVSVVDAVCDELDAGPLGVIIRARVTVIRNILAGGLPTNEREARHG